MHLIIKFLAELLVFGTAFSLFFIYLGIPVVVACRGIYNAVSDIIESVATWKISKKFAIKGGWLAFVPIAKYWLLGRLAEEYPRKDAPTQKTPPWRMLYLTVHALELIIPGAMGALLVILTVLAGDKVDGILDVIAGIGLIPIIIGCILLIATKLFSAYMRYKLYGAMVGEAATWMIFFAALVPIADWVFLLFFAFNKNFPKKQNEEHDGIESLASQAQGCQEPILEEEALADEWDSPNAFNE